MLDKVICCYAGLDDLLSSTIGAARDVYAFAVPASYGWRGIAARVVGPGYVHDVHEIERRLGEAGFHAVHRETVGLWHVGLYAARGGGD